MGWFAPTPSSPVPGKGPPCSASPGIPTVASGPSTRTASSYVSPSTKKARSRSCSAYNTRGEPMDQYARDTLAGSAYDWPMPELTEELRECRKEHAALRRQVERIQEAVSDAAGRPPARRGQAPWRRAVSPLQRALRRRRVPPGRQGLCRNPRRRGAGLPVWPYVSAPTRSTEGCSVCPVLLVRRASSQRETDDLSAPAPGPAPSPPPASGRHASGWPTCASRQARPQLRGFRREVAARTRSSSGAKPATSYQPGTAPGRGRSSRTGAAQATDAPHGTAPYHPQPRRYV